MRRRIDATRWPDRETVDDDSQGVPVATMRALAGYWAGTTTGASVEARLNALPQFRRDRRARHHFLHVRSRHAHALPLMVTHGWPGSIVEQFEDHRAARGSDGPRRQPGDAFHVVIPSLPGYGFSGKPAESGWDPARSRAPGSS